MWTITHVSWLGSSNSTAKNVIVFLKISKSLYFFHRSVDFGRIVYSSDFRTNSGYEAKKREY